VEGYESYIAWFQRSQRRKQYYEFYGCFFQSAPNNRMHRAAEAQFFWLLGMPFGGPVMRSVRPLVLDVRYNIRKSEVLIECIRRSVMTEQERRLEAVHHVVHDYANLVSSGDLTQDESVKPPLNTHIQHAFLLNCRKLADFFTCKSKNKMDIILSHFLHGEKGFDLPVWEDWGKPMNKQLAHLSYERVTNPEKWDGQANKLLLEEFKGKWKLFRSKLPEPYRSEFEKQIRERQQPSSDGQPSEFQYLDLE